MGQLRMLLAAGAVLFLAATAEVAAITGCAKVVKEPADGANFSGTFWSKTAKQDYSYTLHYNKKIVQTDGDLDILMGKYVPSRSNCTMKFFKRGTGDWCDTNHRQAFVRYKCNPNLHADKMTDVREHTACTYLVVMESPRICVPEKACSQEGVCIKCKPGYRLDKGACVKRMRMV